MKHLLTSLFISLLLVTAGIQAADMTGRYQFDNPQQAKDFDILTRELRCLVCQNQSIAESNAPLAVDLKHLVHQKLQEGQSKETIINFLKERYGDFVHYNPGLQKNTWLLWFAPILLMLISLLFIARVIVNASQKATDSVTES